MEHSEIGGKVEEEELRQDRNWLSFGLSEQPSELAWLLSLLAWLGYELV